MRSARGKCARGFYELDLHLFERLRSQQKCRDRVIQARVASGKPGSNGLMIAIDVGNHPRNLKREAEHVPTLRLPPHGPLLHGPGFGHAPDNGYRRGSQQNDELRHDLAHRQRHRVLVGVQIRQGMARLFLLHATQYTTTNPTPKPAPEGAPLSPQIPNGGRVRCPESAREEVLA